MTTGGVLAMVDEVAYQSWQQHIIYEKNRARTSDEQSVTGQVNGTIGADEDASGLAEGSSDEQHYRREVKARQLELVAAVVAGPAACARYLRRQLRVTDEEALRSAVAPLPNALTASELLRLPRYAEERIAESLTDVSPAEAATPVFWTACHAVWIEQGNFDDLVAGFLEGPKADNAEARTRNFLRRTGGLERVRGKVSVLVNCPISMAWWRVRVARDVANVAPRGSLDFDTAHEVLHDATIWAELTGLSVKRLTSLNASNARAAAIVALAQRGSLADEITVKLRKARCQGALRAVARLSHSFSLNTIPWDQLLRAADAGIEESDNEQLANEPSDLTEED